MIAMYYCHDIVIFSYFHDNMLEFGMICKRVTLCDVMVILWEVIMMK
jgi:hypothetical protein